ncbi:unnamed protein product, partial [Mesorhabditis spiculigera]
MYIDLPLNSTSTIICILCYSWIVRWIYRLSAQTETAAGCDKSRKRKNMEIKYAKQFFLISIFYLNAWTSFRYLPPIFGDQHLWLYSFCSLNVLLNYGANGLVYFHTNQEIQSMLRRGSTGTSDYHSSTKGPRIYTTTDQQSKSVHD